MRLMHFISKECLRLKKCKCRFDNFDVGMKFNDILLDEQLKIKTTGRDDSRANTFNYPYEPTDYRVLQRLAHSGLINKKNLLIDYGCGKGRVSFYMSFETGCKSIGVEYDERLYEKANDNLRSYVKPYNVEFNCINAVEFSVPSDADRFYFFNPFSVELLKSVLSNIKESYYDKPRELVLFFYYPSDEYVSALTTDVELDFVDEIDCSDLFDSSDKRERILIFGMT